MRVQVPPAAQIEQRESCALKYSFFFTYFPATLNLQLIMVTKPKIIAIVGPTASGKTSLSIQIAKHINGEVISADSRQVYTGLDIGTGKITAVEMDGVPHHLLDVVEPTEIYTGAQFVRDATAAIDDITSRDRCPIIAGGTFFYVDLLRSKMQAAPVEPDPDYRETLTNYSNEELLELLQHADPRRANDVDPHNRRRLVRALEIIHTLGTVPKPQPVDSPYDWLVLGIETDRDTLREKFKLRLQGWLDQGLLAEVASVRETLSPERFSELGFEYLLTAEYIDQKMDTEEFFERFVQKNWQYAKQQLTWLQKDPDITWVNPKDTKSTLLSVDNFLL